MTNSSIFSAFQRMWQHVVDLVDTKSNVGHKHTLEDVFNGRNTVTSGESLPLGYDNIVEGENNVVVGNKNTGIKGRFITALGRGLTATEDMYGTVIVGRDNVPDTSAAVIISASGVNSMTISKQNKITFTGETTFNNSVVAPSLTGDLIGNADTATSASEDAEGNVISETYFKKSNIIYTTEAEGPTDGVTALEEGQLWFVY